MHRLWIGLSFAGVLVVASCSSDDSKSDGGGDSGGGDSAKTDSGGTDSGGTDSGGMDSAMMDTGVDTGPTDGGLNGCTMFVDRSANNASRTITWGFGPTPKCIEIAQTQTVTWQGDLVTHPLAPLGGSMPTPIMNTSTGTSVMFTFPNTGFYGFRCTQHLGLEGVVHVK
jgi:plastocyanin